MLSNKRLLFCDAFFFLGVLHVDVKWNQWMLNRFKNVIIFYKMTRAINPCKKLYIKKSIQSLMYLRGKNRRILQNSFVIISCLILSAICASVIDCILYISFNILQIQKSI